MSSSTTPDPIPVETESAAPLLPQFLGHPRPLFTLFFAEMWERFSYYGMRALLILFMPLAVADGGLGFSTAKSALIYGTYTMSVYMAPIAGGVIADSLIGARLAVILGGIVIACGHFTMAFASERSFFLGLALVVIGTGLLKANISAMVGNLYPRTDVRRDAGFSLFYMGINIGAASSPLVTGFLAQHSWFKARLAAWGFNPLHSWHWGFAAAGVGMVLGLVVFVAFGKGLRSVGPRPPVARGAWKKPLLVTLGTVVLWLIGWWSDKPGYTWIRGFFLVVPLVLMLWFGFAKDINLRRLGAVFYFFIGAFIFWALFEQAGSSLNLFADRFTQTHLLGFEFPSSWYQSANPVFVILLAPVFTLLWTKLGHRQPSSPLKFAAGLLFLAIAFGAMVPAARLALDGRVSPIWLLALYFFQTCGEMCLSPVGLSTFTKLSPPQFVGAMLGLWFLADSFGNKFAGVLASGFGEGDASHLDRFFGQQALAVFVVAGIFFGLVPWVRRRMGDVR
jgi:POT family proton-dependent oligopeptide transporter